MEELETVPCTIMRGGTSKAVFFLVNDVPCAPHLREKFLLAVFGSPDKRQIDGLGGADPLTSKCAIIGPPSRQDADVDYYFYQVSIDAEVVKESTCGNISAAVGPFAIHKGLVRATEPITEVRVHTPYTGKIFTAEVEIRNGKPLIEGDYKIDGVPGTGAKVILDWKEVTGGETGKLLPTGNVKDAIDIPGIGKITISLVDHANPVAFVKAADIGLTGLELPDEVDSDKNLLDKLEVIRGAAGELVGLIRDRTKSKEQNPNHPHLSFVASPASYISYSGEKIEAEDVDLVARTMFMQIMHKTYPGTGLLCLGVAARIGGTVVNEMLSPDKLAKKMLTIGHPSGTIETESEVEKINDEFLVKRSISYRTARIIMEGYVYVRKALLK